MKKSRLFVNYFAGVFCLCVAASSNAAIIDVTKLNIDSITISLSGTGFDESDTIVYSPPAIWNMGEYQGVILDYSMGHPSINVLAESTGAYGAPPISGTVDTTLGTIDLNLSDLHITVSGFLSGDFDGWNASTLTLDSNTYNSVTGGFSYGWSDDTILLVNVPIPTNTTVDYSILLTGTASTVPIPPAIWLFGSGLLGLIGIARHKEA
jgi:hypothetical protein